MTRRSYCTLAGVAFGAALLHLVPRSPARGESPQGVIRTFGFYVTGGGDAPDYGAEDSVAVVVLPKLPGESDAFIEFSGCPDFPEALRGMVWTRQPARHVEKGGEKDHGTYFWLATDETQAPPAQGAFAFTGPDGTILAIEHVRVALCNGDCCSGDDNLRWRTVEEGGTEFVIVTAVFSE